MDKRASDESAKIAGLEQDIARIQRSITPSTSVAAARSKAQQIEPRRRQLVQAQKREVEFRSQSAKKLQDLNRQLASLARAEEQDRKRQDAEDRRRRQDEHRHSHQLARDLAERARLHAELARHKYVIDLASLPRKITVLFLASNPLGEVQLRLDEEVRAIGAKIRAADYRDSVDLRHAWAARPGDILQALNEHKPQVVHFSGHGTEEGDLVFQGEAGEPKLVSSSAIAATIATLAEDISLVVFNSCFSAQQAQQVTTHIDFAIGMVDSIGDTAARVFAAQLYSAIGFGYSVGRSFEQACAALMLERTAEEHKPQLYGRAGLDPYEAVLVRPQGSETDEPLQD